MNWAHILTIGVKTMYVAIAVLIVFMAGYMTREPMSRTQAHTLLEKNGTIMEYDDVYIYNSHGIVLSAEEIRLLGVMNYRNSGTLYVAAIF